MKDSHPVFVSTSGLARALFMDHRTLKLRIEQLGIDADAQFLEGGGASDLFSIKRIPEIRAQVGAIVAIHGINVGITSPILQNEKS